MKLYELPQKADVKIFCDLSDGSTFLIFDHVDGMYSYCTTEKGAIVHPSASTDVELVEGGYKLVVDEA